MPEATQRPPDAGGLAEELLEKHGERAPTPPPYLTDAEIHDRFFYHPATAAGADRHETLSGEFAALARLVNAVCPAGREKSTAFTKLEEAKFWASAAIARNPDTR